MLDTNPTHGRRTYGMTNASPTSSPRNLSSKWLQTGVLTNTPTDLQIGTPGNGGQTHTMTMTNGLGEQSLRSGKTHHRGDQWTLPTHPGSHWKLTPTANMKEQQPNPWRDHLKLNDMSRLKNTTLTDMFKLRRNGLTPRRSRTS